LPAKFEDGFHRPTARVSPAKKEDCNSRGDLEHIATFMNKIALTLLTCVAAAGWTHAADTNEPAEGKPRASYAIGLNLGDAWKRQDIDVDMDYDWLVRGLKDAKAGGTPLLTADQVRETLNRYQQELNAKREEKLRQLAEVNKKKADEFLAMNKTAAGVVTTDSGLQYKILTEGDGPTPGPNDMVTVNYKGTLVDNTEVVSSYKRGHPEIFNVSSVGAPRGMAEALAKMKRGAKWQLFIPPNLAYAERGTPIIPPNSVLIFEVELLTNAPPPPPPAPSAPLTSDIIKVPSAEEMKKGAKIETIKAEDVEKLMKQQATNQPPAQEKK
jgi:FKBP-type peptidyl-prolyl cis-trans isomerase